MRRVYAIRSRRGRAALVTFAAALLVTSCEPSRRTTQPSDPPGAADTALTRRQLAALEKARQAELDEAARAALPAITPPPAGDCPDGMLLVDTGHCPSVSRSCERDEYSAPNKITICHRFAQAPPRCLEPERRQRFCIDRYEYPNQQGARSPVMVDFHDAGALCAEQGKRLCWESEWTAACEGPDKLPFPYGYARDPQACNIDNTWLKPSLGRSTTPARKCAAPSCSASTRACRAVRGPDARAPSAFTTRPATSTSGCCSRRSAARAAGPG